MNGVYMLVLTGQGDTDVKLVNKETWDWVMNADLGQSPDDRGESEWNDISVPANVKKAIWDGLSNSEKAWYGHNLDNFEVNVTAGSYNNDRALLAPPLKIDGVSGRFSSLTEAFNWVKKHDLNIVGECHGCIY